LTSVEAIICQPITNIATSCYAADLALLKALVAPPPPPSPGDVNPVKIGHNTNLQDGACVGSLKPDGEATSIGSFVSVGHGAVLQGCTVGDVALIGMNAVLQEGSKVKKRAGL
jgi:hypothetical protein